MIHRNRKDAAATNPVSAPSPSGPSRRSLVTAAAFSTPFIAAGMAAPLSAAAAAAKPRFVSVPRKLFTSSGVGPVVVEQLTNGAARAGAQISITPRNLTWSDGTARARSFTTGDDGRVVITGLRTQTLAGWSGLVGTAGAGITASTITVVAGTPQSRLQNVVDLRFGMFNHFNLGTYTDEEWAAGGQDPAKFAPATVDCGQWADAAAAAGMTHGVLTTKHHDGFALWPTAFGTQNVTRSGYKSDVVRAYVDAFRSRGLRVGLYYSIWDRTHTVQGFGGLHVRDTGESIAPGDMEYTLGQIRELLTNYGPIDTFITDGYAWQMGQQNLPIQVIRDLVRSLQPDCVMIDHGALSQPWLGDAIYFEEPLGVTAPAGNTYAGVQGQTISNGWFWHPATPGESLMAKADILTHLEDLEPKWTTFLLNCPPNRAGRLDDNIVARLAEVGAAWRPNPSREPLPAQMLRVEYPITPTNAFATRSNGDENAQNAIDGYSDRGLETCWSTWGGGFVLPQAITIDLGGTWSNVTSATYLPKQWGRSGDNGDISSYVIAASVDGVTFQDVASGTWAVDATPKLVEWPARNARYVRLTARAASGGYVNVSGITVGGRSVKPELVGRTFTDPNATYRIEGIASAKAVTVAGGSRANGADVRQFGFTGAGGQIWKLEPTGDGFHRIRDAASGLVLEVAGRSRSNGGNVAVWQDDNVFQQQWAITRSGSSAYILVNRFSRLALNIDGASISDDADVNQWAYDGSAQQLWSIVSL